MIESLDFDELASLNGVRRSFIDGRRPEPQAQATQYPKLRANRPASTPDPGPSDRSTYTGAWRVRLDRTSCRTSLRSKAYRLTPGASFVRRAQNFRMQEGHRKQLNWEIFDGQDGNCCRMGPTRPGLRAQTARAKIRGVWRSPEDHVSNGSRTQCAFMYRWASVTQSRAERSLVPATPMASAF